MLPTKKIRIFASLEEAAKAVPAGTLRKLRIGETLLCLAHTPQGFMAMADTCPHQQASLSGGVLDVRLQVVCPFHHYRYSLHTGEEASRRTAPVQTYVVESSEEGVFVHLPQKK
ncbi:Rieske (2Fe-2S) protein [Cesiribacter andamanensis]|uniref:Digoxigenin ferredoxin subunit n=1 Tax=Cesiribacter andamanensis AMV16 TaxID=1279009 RepID=M7N767_9BACT|nr:Rieske (2Fe-2S) protein [Cesiribacter andamanensis]EMR03086.1 Digoxigenin ferredoxin subunit [Cesiribacter andamanensis AMV16]